MLDMSRRSDGVTSPTLEPRRCRVTAWCLSADDPNSTILSPHETCFIIPLPWKGFRHQHFLQNYSNRQNTKSILIKRVFYIWTFLAVMIAINTPMIGSMIQNVQWTFRSRAQWPRAGKVKDRKALLLFSVTWERSNLNFEGTGRERCDLHNWK